VTYLSVVAGLVCTNSQDSFPFAGFDVPTAAIMKSTIIYDMIPYSVV
jgi:hypothetical protein